MWKIFSLNNFKIHNSMIIKTDIIYDKSLGKLKCDICESKFRANTRIYRVKNNFGYVCEHCNDTFSKEDLKLVIVLFNCYGGFFGKYKEKKISLDKILTDFYDRLSVDGNLKNLLEYNKKLCHRALLFGFTPQQLISKMKGAKKF